jgi:hypothetical protein
MIGDGDKFQERGRRTKLWERVSIDCPKVIDMEEVRGGIVDKSAGMQNESRGRDRCYKWTSMVTSNRDQSVEIEFLNRDLERGNPSAFTEAQ